MSALPIRTFQIIPAFSGYGADKLVVELHRSFLKRGVDSHIITFAGECPSGIPFVSSLGLEKPYHPKAVFCLSKKLKEITKQDPDKPNLLHTHLTPCQLWVPIAARIAALDVPLLMTEHSTNTRRRAMPFGKFFDRLLYKPYRHVVCISAGVETSMIDWLPEIEGKLMTINNGIDIDEFRETQQPDQNTECPVIISVGRLQRMKNYQAAIEACALIKDLNFEYHILGDGPEKPALRKLIEEKYLANRVKLMGFQPNVSTHLYRSNIFLMSSCWEGFGLAVVEAMACGLPVVVSDVSGVREIVGQGQKGGFLVNPQDPVCIAEKLRCLIVSQKLRADMGAYNRLHARRYSIDQTVQGYLDLYQRIF